MEQLFGAKFLNWEWRANKGGTQIAAGGARRSHGVFSFYGKATTLDRAPWCTWEPSVTSATGQDLWRSPNYFRTSPRAAANYDLGLKQSTRRSRIIIVERHYLLGKDKQASIYARDHLKAGRFPDTLSTWQGVDIGGNLGLERVHDISSSAPVFTFPLNCTQKMASSRKTIGFDIPGARVWNANFRQQMVYQSSLCYRDLTLHHFVV